MVPGFCKLELPWPSNGFCSHCKNILWNALFVLSYNDALFTMMILVCPIQSLK